MHVLDHDDRGIDHGPYRDRDAAEGHDVCGQPLARHGNEGEQHSNRQGQDGYQRASEVEQEENDDKADDHHLLC